MRSREAAGVDLVETPAYVYYLDELRAAHARLLAALPQPSTLFYSLKANPHPAIVGTLGRLGCSAEVSSPGELATARAVGIAADRILVTGPGKRDADVREAVEAGVDWFSVDSPHGLDQVNRIANAAGRDARCLVRVNVPDAVPGQGLAMAGGASQFGADVEWIADRPADFRRGLAGLHLYLGTNLASERDLLAQFGTAIATADRLTDVLGVPPQRLDIGGGFGAPYARTGPAPAFGSLADGLANLLDAHFPGWRNGRPKIAFESGRYLVATSGELRTRVLDVKESCGRPVVVLESGVNHLGGLSGLRRLPLIVPELQHGRGDGVLRNAIITGPLCTPVDAWARGADAPAVRPGDVVLVSNVGAYGLSASLLAFLGHPAPREVVVDGGRIVDVTQLVLARRTPPGAWSDRDVNDHER